MSSGERTVILGPSEGQVESVLDMPFRFVVEGPATRNAYAVVEITLAKPGDGAPQHTHEKEDEGFYVLEGEVEILVGDRTIVGTPGAFVHVPNGMVHAFAYAGKTPGRFLHFISPAGFEQFFKEIAGPPDMDKLNAIAPKYGLEIVGPVPGQ